VRILSRQRSLNFPPGTEYQYDKGGYNLLASLVKRATGLSLPAFADANIFKPLGMTHSSFRNIPTAAIGYSRNAKGWRENTDKADVVGNSGMYSTVGDLLRWERNFDDVRVGSPAALAAMQKPPTLRDGTTSSYGFGLAVGQYRGAPTVEHSGAEHGVATKVVRFPRQRFAVAVLCNEDSVAMGGLARVNPDVFTNGIADIYLADVVEPVEASAKTEPSPTPVKLPAPELAEKTGLYRVVSSELPILISVNDGALMLRSYYQDDTDVAMTPVGGNRFLLQNTVPLEFVPAAADRPKEWFLGEGNGRRTLQPVTQTISLAEARSYSGQYRSEEIGIVYTLEARDDALTIRSERGRDILIVPFGRDIFVGDEVGIVRFSRDQRGTVTGFTVSRDAARGVRFDRVNKRAG
jgi:hypothetical protein